MTGITRREFGTIVMAGVPLAAVFGATKLAAAGPVKVGVTGWSFRDLPRVEGQPNISDVLSAIKTVGATDVELEFANIEPAPPKVAPFMGGSPSYPKMVYPSPAEVAASNQTYRGQLRQWRLATRTTAFEAARRDFAAAGINISAAAVTLNGTFTDEELDVTFEQAKALGVKTIATPLSMAVAPRLAPFAQKHQIAIAVHNQVDGNADQTIATAEIPKILALSPAFTLRLDIGNLTASNFDAVTELREYQSRVSMVVVKDRLRNGGVSQPLGEGDTPIQGVVNLLKTAPASIPALVEYDYVGLRPVIDEVEISYKYVAGLAK